MKQFSNIEQIIEDARNGKMYILVDSEDRENEGDLIIPASLCDANHINFMATHGRGLICLSITEARARDLKLPLMNPDNWKKKTTAFTISIESSKNITTGISAHDRAETVRAAINPQFRQGDIVSPGHIFPLIAWDGGVLTRAGHTEAAVDISKLAGLDESAVICEIMNDDGTMARVPDLLPYAEKHNINIGTIQDLIAYRIKNDILIKKIPEKNHQIKNIYSDVFEFNIFENTIDGLRHATLHLGDLAKEKSILTRVHPVQGFDDVVMNFNNPKTKDLHASLDKIKSNGSGIVVLINSPILNDLGELSNDEKVKYYGLGAQILKNFSINDITVLSNSYDQKLDLSIYGLNVSKIEKI
jgi:3,4-dihydroxy 2-butanone 4-phosphate synthase/GTP cyclohydrolase II